MFGAWERFSEQEGRAMGEVWRGDVSLMKGQLYLWKELRLDLVET